MRTISPEELKVILEKHKEWLESDGSKGERANLSNANLYKVNLSEANLSYAYLFKANLSNADLSKADLSNAELYNSYLSNANLSYANLFNANLSEASISYANLYNANLYNANLSYAALYNANLQHVKDVISFTLGKHFGYAWRNSNKDIIVKIGCLEHPIDEWLKNSKSIGLTENYSLEDRKFYRSMLHIIKKRLK